MEMYAALDLHATNSYLQSSMQKACRCLIPDYSASKQPKVCSWGQPSDMVKEIDRYWGKSDGREW